MQGQAFGTASRARLAPPGALALLWLMAAVLFTGPAFAQSFLGTIRGTVVDPQGAPVQGAAVLIVDEATGVPRSVETDAEGRYEASNLRPGTYRVEVVTHELQEGRADRDRAARQRHRPRRTSSSRWAR